MTSKSRRVRFRSKSAGNQEDHSNIIRFETKTDDSKNLSRAILPSSKPKCESVEQTIFCTLQYENGTLRYEGHVCVITHQKHGHGCYVDKVGNRYEGNFLHNKRHGWGMYTFSESGNYYRGQFEEGRFHGHGTHVWRVCRYRHRSFDGYPRDDKDACALDIYHGQWQNNSMHGYGVKTLSNGDVYAGYWEDNLAHGWGRKDFASSRESYEGMFEKDKREGYGSYEWSNGDSYKGEWICGLRHGKGVLTFSNGDYYQGDFEFDVAFGFGIKCFSHSGDIYEGEFVDDARHGYGTYKWSLSEAVYKGDWEANAMNGLGTFTAWNDEFDAYDDYDGEFADSKFHGIGLMKYANGDTYQGSFEYGMRHGQGCYTWANDGNRFQGSFDQGAIHGRGAFVFRNGSRLEGKWIKGRLVETFEHEREDDLIAEEGIWENDLSDTDESGTERVSDAPTATNNPSQVLFTKTYSSRRNNSNSIKNHRRKSVHLRCRRSILFQRTAKCS